MEDYMDFFEIKFDDTFTAEFTTKEYPCYIDTSNMFLGTGGKCTKPSTKVLDNTKIQGEAKVLDRATLTKKDVAGAKIKK